jgi:hypothetical protein
VVEVLKALELDVQPARALHQNQKRDELHLRCWRALANVFRSCLNSAVTSWETSEPAPEIQAGPAAFVFHKTERLTICFFL